MELGRKKVRLGELLVNSGVITAEQLQQALDNPNRQGKKLGEFLVDEGIVSEDDLAKALSRQLDLDMIDLQSVNVDKEVLNLVPVNVLKKNKIFPFAYKENNFNVLMVAMADPLDYNAIDDINIITNFQVEPVVATTRSIMLAIDKYFGLIVHSSEVQKNFLSLPVCRDGNLSLIPHLIDKIGILYA